MYIYKVAKSLGFSFGQGKLKTKPKALASCADGNEEFPCPRTTLSRDRYNTLKNNRKTISALVLIAVVGLIIFKSCSHDIDFDSIKWKNWSESNENDWNLRWDMADDLIDNYLEKGMSIREVSELLGGSGGSGQTKFTMSFNLGPCRRGIDYGSLEIFFVDGKLKSVKKHCH